MKLAHMVSFLLCLLSQLFQIAFNFTIVLPPGGYLLVAVIIFGFRSPEEVFVHSSCLFTVANVRPNNGVIKSPSCQWTELSTCGFL